MAVYIFTNMTHMLAFYLTRHLGLLNFLCINVYTQVEVNEQFLDITCTVQVIVKSVFRIHIVLKRCYNPLAIYTGKS